MSDETALWLHPNAGENQPRSNGMTDYKFFCFGGEPRFLYVSDGFENPSTARVAFLEMDWTRAPFTRTDHRAYERVPERPATYDEMVGLSKNLSEGIPFVRVDFFEHGGRPRFSEMTFYHCSGFMPFQPPEWDTKIGALLELPCPIS